VPVNGLKLRVNAREHPKEVSPENLFPATTSG
jgi:hypothetical protein